MASIRKRNGKYQVQVRRAGYQTLSRTFTHRKDAQEWANETELKADRRGMPENLKEVNKMTLGEGAIRSWLESRPENDIHWEFINNHMAEGFESIEQAVENARKYRRAFEIERI